MTDRRLYLGLDLGTSSIKAGLFSTDGVLVATSTVEYPLNSPQPDWVECNPQVYWDATLRATKDCLMRANEDGQSVAGLATSCQGETLIVLDADGVAMRPAMVHLDNRAQAEANDLGALLGEDEIYRATGQVACIATWTACKILWLRRHEPRVFQDAARFLLVEDWLLYRLTGRFVGETNLHVTSLLIELKTHAWWDSMLTALDIDADQLPELVEPGTVIGGLTGDAAKELGLPVGLPVIAGAMDQILAAAGAGNIAPGTLTELTGTVLGFASCVREQPAGRHLSLPTCLHVVPDMYCVQPCAQTAGILLQWARDNFYGTEGGVTLSFDSVISEAAGIGPGANGLTVVPHFAGAQYPEFNSRATGAVVGLTLAHGRGHLIRGILEAVAFMLRNAIENMRSGGLDIHEISSLGKSTQSDLWTQIKADVCQLPVQRMECIEPSLLGAAMLVAVGLGDVPDIHAASRLMVRRKGVTLPDPTNAEIYDVAFGRYLSAYERLFGGDR